MGFSATVPRFGMVGKLNFARAFLFRAADALQRGDVIAAACLLREAIRRQCWAECQWFDCLPQGASDRTPPMTLIKALKKAGQCGHEDYGFDCVKEMIQLANAVVHCQPIKAKYIGSSISLLHCMIDATPCNEPTNMAGLPKEPEHCCDWDDDDDDDASNWWKPEGWNPKGGAA